MADINATDFYKGALWAADILLSTSSSNRYQEEVRDILEHIPNLYSVVMQTPETEVFDLRLFVDKEFPLGRNAAYTAFKIVALDSGGDILPLPKLSADPDEMYEPTTDVDSWGVAATTLDGKDLVLIMGIIEPRVAADYAQRFAEQLAVQQKA
ncbi:hypothetical protein [Providencia sneebia]|uniref:Uncharacterized protein n=1 Tax=Providencia sneebia DSM 19967 TaxID=1141660 RepID=K8W8J9_9GAMM|nr:hypothetical protein [Providencia sneebia]EKT56201.1 hypothetical protein OO7_09677 [Providencia sneebia DSM 19967]